MINSENIINNGKINLLLCLVKYKANPINTDIASIKSNKWSIKKFHLSNPSF